MTGSIIRHSPHHGGGNRSSRPNLGVDALDFRDAEAPARGTIGGDRLERLWKGIWFGSIERLTEFGQRGPTRGGFPQDINRFRSQLMDQNFGKASRVFDEDRSS